MEIVLRDGRKRVIARLRFRVCPACRTGRIRDVWVDEAWQRQGLGREALLSLLVLRPGHRWSTTLKTRQGRAFFRAMTRETSTDFPAAAPLCPHLRGRLGQFVHRVTGRPRAPWTEPEMRRLDAGREHGPGPSATMDLAPRGGCDGKGDDLYRPGATGRDRLALEGDVSEENDRLAALYALPFALVAAPSP